VSNDAFDIREDGDVAAAVPEGVLSLVGSWDDAPEDLRTNADQYLSERAARHGNGHA